MSACAAFSVLRRAADRGARRPGVVFRFGRDVPFLLAADFFAAPDSEEALARFAVAAALAPDGVDVRLAVVDFVLPVRAVDFDPDVDVADFGAAFDDVVARVDAVDRRVPDAAGFAPADFPAVFFDRAPFGSELLDLSSLSLRTFAIVTHQRPFARRQEQFPT